MPQYTKSTKATIARPSVKFRSADAGRTMGVTASWPASSTWAMPMVPTPGRSPIQFATRIIRKSAMITAT
jgi:hypothetical protein